MLEEYNIENFNSYLDQDRTADEVCAWFDQMAKDYHDLKKANLATDEVKFQLLDFWKALQSFYGDSVYNLLNDHWRNKKIEVIKDFHEYAPTYTRICCERIYNNLDIVEKEEAKALISDIWNKNMRAEISFSFYDYDADTFQELGINIPRLKRDNMKNDFELLCLKTIYNRGSLLVKMYGARGFIEFIGVSVDEDGRWSCLNESEIAFSYRDNNNKPLTMGKNEHVGVLEHALRNKTAPDLSVFNPKYS